MKLGPSDASAPPRDFRGRWITPGCVLAYGGRDSVSSYLRAMVVDTVTTGPEGLVTLYGRRLGYGARPGQVKIQGRPDNVAVMEVGS